MVKNTIKIGHLYPKQMNVYGDMGNVITLRYRLESRGYKVEYIRLDSLQDFTKMKVDILIGGGGQDSNQNLVEKDLQKYAKQLQHECSSGLVALMVCGLYQLFGNKFILQDKTEIPGIGIIDMETIAHGDRLIGNVVVDSAWGELVGFENHSGRTYLGPNITPLGKVIKGSGNHGGNDEGAVVNNVFGTYMHGPVLAKNPELTDELIKRALSRQSSQHIKLIPLDDSIEHKASAAAMKRPR